MCVVLAVVLGVLAGPQTSLAQTDPFTLDDASAGATDGTGADVVPTADRSSSASSRANAGQSFGSAFFISWKFRPGSDERRIEWLGSLVIWFLILLSMGSLGLIGFMAATNRRRGILPIGVVEESRRLIQSGEYKAVIDLTRRESSFFSQVLHAGLRDANHGYASMLRNLEQTSIELTTDRLRRIEYLNVLGQVSPMIGLFGTVYGMILAFQAIVVAGGNADPVLLAGGIGTALTTTFWGLVVAIPALAGYAIVRNGIDALTAEATLVAQELIAPFRPQQRSAGASPSRSETA